MESRAVEQATKRNRTTSVSGIGALLQRDGQPADRAKIERIARALTMYGPERQLVRTAGPIAFAYTHMTSTPEDRGQYQPVTGGGGRYVMVFDGRLDNRDDLISQLGLPLHEARLLSDATLAMRTWEKWTTGALLEWVGEFALIVWDGSERELIAARDHFGLRPLSYYASSGQFIAATAPKGLHAIATVPRELDEQKLALALCHLYIEPTRSYFKDIHRVPPGGLVRVRGDKLSVEIYYAIREHVREIHYRHDDDYVEAARELLDRSVSARLRSSGPVGAFMSGGLDSSTVAVTAARLLANGTSRLPTFTWVPEPGWDGIIEPQWYGDETPYVKAIAEKHPNIELNLIDAAGLTHYYKQDEFLAAGETPVRNALNLSWFHKILETASQRGIRVMLEGGQGNFTLSYAGLGLFHQLLRERRYGEFARELVRQNKGLFRALRHAPTYVFWPYAPQWLWDFKEKLRGRPDDERFSRSLMPIHPAYEHDTKVIERGRPAAVRMYGRRPRTDLRDYRINAIEDGMLSEGGDIYKAFAAMHGIELRDPFADRRLTEWCFGVPDDQFRRNGEKRWLLKRLMRGVIPDVVLDKPYAAGIQVSDWHLRMTRERDRMRGELEAFQSDPDLSRMLDIPRMKSALEDWPTSTPIARDDDTRHFVPLSMTAAMQIGRFVQRVKGYNSGNR
jgi:asparagine synthase (glutamine-hydrolysing)